jgi:hypothetical protein
MRVVELAIKESSGYSLEGSFTPDLVFSKFWLMRELDEIRSNIPAMYILGSWYGNLALMINRYQTHKVDRVINVENNKRFLDSSQDLLMQAGADSVTYMAKDANALDYRQLGDQGVVVNTSLTDMPGRKWFDHIPPGTLVVLQARDHDPGEQFDSPKTIQQRFPMSKVLYSGSLELEDPETPYTRFMVIGIK